MKRMSLLTRLLSSYDTERSAVRRIRIGALILRLAALGLTGCESCGLTQLDEPIDPTCFWRSAPTINNNSGNPLNCWRVTAANESALSLTPIEPCDAPELGVQELTVRDGTNVYCYFTWSPGASGFFDVQLAECPKELP